MAQVTLQLQPYMPPNVLQGPTVPQNVASGMIFVGALAVLGGIVWAATALWAPKPKKSQLGFPVEDLDGLALDVLDWNDGQASEAYAVGSSWHAGNTIDHTRVLNVAEDLEREHARAKRAGRARDVRGAQALARRLRHTVHAQRPRKSR